MKNKIPNSVEIIDSHLDDFFSTDADIVVFDEIESDIIHRDIFIIKPTDELPFNLLLSCGMSALPMNIPEGIDSSEFVELMFLLPEDWNLESEDLKDEQNYWPIRLMKEIMMAPHVNSSWFGFGHTYEYGGDEEFASGVGFTAVILVSSMEISEEFTEIHLNNNKVIDIYSLIPLYKEELEFKKQYGVNELLEKFDEYNIEEVLKIGRVNVCV